MIQIPANVCGWRANFKDPTKSDIPRVQCDPVQAHQSILGLTEEYKDKVRRGLRISLINPRASLVGSVTAQGLNTTRMIRWIHWKQDAFRPFEQNLKKVNIVGTYGAIYSVGIQIDRNSEMRQGNLQLRANLKLTSILAELVDCMRELFQQVREEIHTLRVELSEVRAELSALVS